MEEEFSTYGLSKWFKENWVDIGAPKKKGKFQKCGRAKGSGRAYPKCVPASKAARMTKAQKTSSQAAQVRPNRQQGTWSAGQSKQPTHLTASKTLPQRATSSTQRAENSPSQVPQFASC